MAINVNVISENNAFNVENANYCTVALPITACWGPGFSLSTADPTNTSSEVNPIEVALENTAWSLFPAGPDGLESFIATYRGPSSNYRSTKDYSYFMALSLLNAGYAVQTCRLCPGTRASTTVPAEGGSGSGNDASATGSLVITAKYPGTFGNNLKVSLKKKGNSTFTYWNLIGYAVDANGNSRAVENLVFVFKPEDSTDTIVSIDELQSKFFDFKIVGEITEDQMETEHQALQGGADVADASDQDAATIMADAIKLAEYRYNEGADYLRALNNAKEAIGNNKSAAEAIRFNEWVYTYTIGIKGSTESGINGVYDLLKDKINYNPNRIICPWDDQDILAIDPDYPVTDMEKSPMHLELMEVANASRCATAYIDVPRSLPRSKVWNDNEGNYGYAQQLSHVAETDNDPLYASNAALFAPWGQYVYSGTSRQAPATPSFMALLIDRAMIKNQPTQYEWALPTTRNNNVRLGQLAYTVPKTLLDNWQGSEGTRINSITTVPSLGTTIWGNATLFDVPVATYNALQNLSTRKLINAVKDTVFKIGIGMEFQYNGQEAYAKFYAGVTPLLDTMRNVGAIENYKVQMAADINNVDSINANSVVGTIYLVIAGVIENITVDLIALPQGTDLSQY
jgi:hypothetical protein